MINTLQHLRAPLAAVDRDPPDEFLTQVLKEARRTHALVLAVDEIANMDAGVAEKSPDFVDTQHAQYRVLRNTLLNAVCASAFEGARPVHVMVAGRVTLGLSQRLLDQGAGSRYTNERVLLQALGQHHVRLLVNHYQFAAPNAECAEALATAIHRLTAGVPRTIHHMLSTIKVLNLDVSSLAVIGKTALDVAQALATSKLEVFKHEWQRIEKDGLDEYLALAAHNMANIPLPVRPKPGTPERRLLDSTMHLPSMFERTPDGQGVVPRVAVLFTHGLRELLAEHGARVTQPKLQQYLQNNLPASAQGHDLLRWLTSCFCL